jgi:hypothetical protein
MHLAAHLGWILGGCLTATLAVAEARHPDYQLPVLEFEQDAEGYYVNVSDEAYLRYMWDSFVALSWPAKARERGQPDTRATAPATKSPVVWETLPQPQEVFLLPSAWSDYPQWDQIESLPVGLTVAEAQALCTGYSPRTDIILYDINQPNTSIRDGPVAPLMDQHRRYVRYQVAMNKSFFEYVRQHDYFDASVQRKAVRITEHAQFTGQPTPPVGGFVGLPADHADQPGMLEIKSAWRILDPEHDQAERYYSRPGFILSPDRTNCEAAPTLGLVALHIHRLTRLSHVASTFEQIDNVAILDPTNAGTIHPSFNPGVGNDTQRNIWPPYGNLGFDGRLPPLISGSSTLPSRHRRQPNNISRATPIPAPVRSINRDYQQRHSDSPLRYYQIINAQHVRQECRLRETGDYRRPREWEPTTCPQPNTRTLINSALESYTQLTNPFDMTPHNYSCQGCHAHARPCGFAGQIKPELSFRPEFMVMSYLLSKAKFPGQLEAPEGYSCINPATQPPQNSKSGADTGKY